MAFFVVFGIVIASVVFARADVGVVFPKSAFDGPVETRFLTDGDRVAVEREPCHAMCRFVGVL